LEPELNECFEKRPVRIPLDWVAHIRFVFGVTALGEEGPAVV